MLRRYKVTGIGNPKPPKKRKQFLMLLLALVVTVPALSLLKTSVLADNKNIINVDSDTYNITADLGDGTFTPGSKPEFNKMPNGKWLYKYKPTDREVALPIPTNEGYRFTGWYVEQSQTPNPDYKIPKWNNKNIEVRAGWEVLNSTLVPGPTFNQKIKAMPNYNSIRRINFMVGTPSPNGIDLSIDSNKAITATVTGDTLNVKCTGTIFTNRNCDRMFRDFVNITDIAFDNFNTSKTVTMHDMFCASGIKDGIDLTKLDTSNVTDMFGMFYSCKNLTTLDITSFNTAKLQNMGLMFADSTNLKTVKMTGLNLDNVSVVRHLFKWCRNLNHIDLSEYKFLRVAEMSQMFWDCEKLSGTMTINSNVTKYDGMFENCSSDPNAKFIVKYKDAQTKEVARRMVATKNPGDHVYLYEESSTLLSGSEFNNKIEAMPNYNSIRKINFLKGTPNPDGVDLSEKQDKSITGTISGDTLNISCNNDIFANSNCASMFYGFTKITSITFDNFNTSKVTDMRSMFSGCSGLTSLDLSNFDTSNVTNMRYMFYDCGSLTNLNVSNFNTSKVTNMGGMFRICSSLTNLNVSNFDTSNVTNMSYMFCDCSGLTNLDVSNFNTSKVTDMGDMFRSCSKLTNLNVSNFNTSNVTGMSYMFCDCSGLTSLDVSNFDTSKVTITADMFSGCSKLTNLDVSNFDTSKVTNIADMFSGCSKLTNLNVSNFDTSKVTDMQEMFKHCSSLTSLNVSNFDTSNVIMMDGMFSGCSGLTSLDVSNFNTSDVENMDEMFAYCNNLTNLDLSNFDTSRVTLIYDMFRGCSKLTSEITIKNSNVIKYTYMFEGCSSAKDAKFVVKYVSPETKELARKMVATKNPEDHVYLYEAPASTLLPGSEFNKKIKTMYGFNNVTTINFNESTVNPYGIDLSEKQDGSIRGVKTGNTLNINCEGEIFANSDSSKMFSYLRVNNINFNNFNTSNVTNMYMIFGDCSSLISLDLSSFDTSRITSTNSMFDGCSSLTTLNMSSFDTSRITHTARMFSGCSKLTSLDLSNFNTSNITDMRSMFSSCSSLTKLNVSNFNTSKVTGMSGMFSGCSKLTSLDLSNFDTSKVTNMQDMFRGCSSLTTLNVSNFDTSKVTNMQDMFANCSKITSLDLSNFDTSKVINMEGMFKECSSLTSGITIMNPNVNYYIYMFYNCSTEPNTRFTVNYTYNCRDMSQKLRNTKTPNSNVVLGREVRAVSDAKPNKSTAPKPVTITLHNGAMAQTQEEKRLIQHGVIGYLGNPELNPQYSGVFGGYYYDQDCTRPVKPTDPIAQDTDLYARW